MKTILQTLLCLCIALQSKGQCTNTNQYPSTTVSASTFNDTIDVGLGIYAGEYSVIDQLLPGETYIISSTTPSDYLTIRDSYDPTILLAQGSSPLTYTPVDIDIAAIHVNLISPPCGSESIARITTIVCSTCPEIPPSVGVNTSEPQATFDVDGEIKLSNSVRPPSAGMIRWNEEVSDFEGYNGEKWLSLTKANASTWGQASTSTAQEDQNCTTDIEDDNANFGCSVSISGNYAIIGASGENNGNGAAYIYYRTGSSWTQQAKLTAFDGSAFQRFGTSVSINGDYAVIGKPNDNTYTGSAYIYHRTGSIWTLQTKITPNDGNSFDEFGRSTSISGNYVVIGSANGVGGSAYIYLRNGSLWTQQAKIKANDEAANDNFGTSVSINGNYIVVGAPGDDIEGNVNQGSAYIYLWNSVSWTQQEKIMANNGNAEDIFGASVAIQGNNTIIGATGKDTNTGAAYIYVRTGSTWMQQASIIANDGETQDEFGNSIAIDGDFAIVGASGHDSSTGASYIYHRTGNNWTQQTKIKASDNDQTDLFGISVSISEEYTIIGASSNKVGVNPDQGSAYFIDKK